MVVPRTAWREPVAQAEELLFEDKVVDVVLLLLALPLLCELVSIKHLDELLRVFAQGLLLRELYQVWVFAVKLFVLLNWILEPLELLEDEAFKGRGLFCNFKGFKAERGLLLDSLVLGEGVQIDERGQGLERHLRDLLRVLGHHFFDLQALLLCQRMTAAHALGFAGLRRH